MPVSFETYKRVAMEDDEAWELVCGRLRKKPPMTTEHGWSIAVLTNLLVRQTPFDAFHVRCDARLRVSTGTYYVPDLCVVPAAFIRRKLEVPGTFEVYEEPMPLVVEVWSPSTGLYDVEEKLLEYQRRGDLEIWRVHPYERTVTVWRRQADGDYVETLYKAGAITLATLPDVAIEVAALFS